MMAFCCWLPSAVGLCLLQTSLATSFSVQWTFQPSTYGIISDDSGQVLDSIPYCLTSTRRPKSQFRFHQTCDIINNAYHFNLYLHDIRSGIFTPIYYPTNVATYVVPKFSHEQIPQIQSSSALSVQIEIDAVSQEVLQPRSAENSGTADEYCGYPTAVSAYRNEKIVANSLNNVNDLEASWHSNECLPSTKSPAELIFRASEIKTLRQVQKLSEDLVKHITDMSKGFKDDIDQLITMLPSCTFAEVPANLEHLKSQFKNVIESKIDEWLNFGFYDAIDAFLKIDLGPTRFDLYDLLCAVELVLDESIGSALTLRNALQGLGLLLHPIKQSELCNYTLEQLYFAGDSVVINVKSRWTDLLVKIGQCYDLYSPEDKSLIEPPLAANLDDCANSDRNYDGKAATEGDRIVDDANFGNEEEGESEQEVQVDATSNDLTLPSCHGSHTPSASDKPKDDSYPLPITSKSELTEIDHHALTTLKDKLREFEKELLNIEKFALKAAVIEPDFVKQILVQCSEENIHVIFKECLLKSSARFHQQLGAKMGKFSEDFLKIQASHLVLKMSKDDFANPQKFAAQCVVVPLRIASKFESAVRSSFVNSSKAFSAKLHKGLMNKLSSAENVPAAKNSQAAKKKKGQTAVKRHAVETSQAAQEGDVVKKSAGGIQDIKKIVKHLKMDVLESQLDQFGLLRHSKDLRHLLKNLIDELWPELGACCGPFITQYQDRDLSFLD